MDVALARERFARLARFEPGAPALARELFDELAGAEPDSEAARLLINAPLVWAAHGFGEPLRAVFRDWRRARELAEDVATAELALLVTIDPAAAAVHFEGSGDNPRGARALAVINRVYRGDVAGAIELCEADDWFLDDDRLAHGLFHGLWALGFADRDGEATAILDRWRALRQELSVRARAFLYRIEAGVASHANRHRLALERIGDALAICAEEEMHLSRVFAEATAASVRARAGELDGAAQLIAGWSDDITAGPLAGFRDVGRVELALFAGDPAAPEHLERALAYFEATRNRVMVGFLLLRAVLAAPIEARTAELERFRHAVRAAPVPRFARALTALDRLFARFGTDVGDPTLASRLHRESAPLARVWIPPLRATNADLFWNRPLGQLHVRGAGPLATDRSEVLSRLLAGLFEAPGFAISIGDLAERVWELDYDPAHHHNKVHVAIHRLRRQLDELSPGAGAIVEVVDGVVRLSEAADVAVLYF